MAYIIGEVLGLYRLLIGHVKGGHARIHVSPGDKDMGYLRATCCSVVENVLH